VVRATGSMRPVIVAASTLVVIVVLYVVGDIISLDDIRPVPTVDAPRAADQGVPEMTSHRRRRRDDFLTSSFVVVVTTSLMMTSTFLALCASLLSVDVDAIRGQLQSGLQSRADFSLHNVQEAQLLLRDRATFVSFDKKYFRL